MEVYYASERLQRTCQTERECRKKWGPDGSKKITLRLTQLDAAETLADMRGIGHCEELTGDRYGSLSLRLHGAYRLVFKPTEWAAKDDGGLDWGAVTAVVILDVTDYH